MKCTRNAHECTPSLFPLHPPGGQSFELLVRAVPEQPLQGAFGSGHQLHAVRSGEGHGEGEAGEASAVPLPHAHQPRPPRVRAPPQCHVPGGAQPRRLWSRVYPPPAPFTLSFSCVRSRGLTFALSFPSTLPHYNFLPGFHPNSFFLLSGSLLFAGISARLSAKPFAACWNTTLPKPSTAPPRTHGTPLWPRPRLCSRETGKRRW